jgi:hypothetical protein
MLGAKFQAVDLVLLQYKKFLLEYQAPMTRSPKRQSAKEPIGCVLFTTQNSDNSTL